MAVGAEVTGPTSRAACDDQTDVLIVFAELAWRLAAAVFANNWSGFERPCQGDKLFRILDSQLFDDVLTDLRGLLSGDLALVELLPSVVHRLCFVEARPVMTYSINSGSVRLEM